MYDCTWCTEDTEFRLRNLLKIKRQTYIHAVTKPRKVIRSPSSTGNMSIVTARTKSCHFCAAPRNAGHLATISTRVAMRLAAAAAILLLSTTILAWKLDGRGNVVEDERLETGGGGGGGHRRRGGGFYLQEHIKRTMMKNAERNRGRSEELSEIHQRFFRYIRKKLTDIFVLLFTTHLGRRKQ